MKARILSIGIELEGGLPSDSVDKLRAKWGRRFEFDTDGSVRVPEPAEFTGRWIWRAELKYWCFYRRRDRLFEFVRDAWNLGLKQNATCGNHVHFRFVPGWAWKVLSFKQNFEKFIAEYEREFPEDKYLKRLNNNYCLATYQGVPESTDPKNSWAGCRYRALNFLSLWERQKTLEIRLLPWAENAEELVSAIQKLAKIVKEAINWQIDEVAEVLVRTDMPYPKEIEVTINKLDKSTEELVIEVEEVM